MLGEEVTNMEKLHARSLNLALDSKGKQDVGSKFGRDNVGCGGRRREGGPSFSGPRFDPHSSKPWPQRQGGQDKRPASKGAFPTVVRNGNQVANVQTAEIGSAIRPGAKKQNFNHLLNFSYARREVTSRDSRHGTRNNNNNSIWTTQKHRYNKEQFLQANCQFIVREGNDYGVHAADPDLLVDWEWIEQVRVRDHEVPSCPICLYPPVSAKMTRCGHIYCWPCILHYLALTDDSWRKCPICYEAIHKTDLKSVVSLETLRFNVGEEITMQLMRRERGSVVALPSSRFEMTCGAPFRLDSSADDCYAKLLLATRKQVLDDVVGREESELNVALQIGEGSPEVCFVESALEQLKARKAKLLESMKSSAEPELVSATAPIEKKAEAVKPICYRSAFSDEEGDMDDQKAEADSCAVGHAFDDDKRATTSAVPQCNKGAYYFYQAVDGQHIYMSSLNSRMLAREYGSPERRPAVITAVIVAKDGITMNEELRCRLGFLRHLPLTCEFELVELRLDSNVVSRETSDEFAGEIAEHHERRNRRAREERRRERLLRAEENKRKEPFAGSGLCLDSLDHFPEYVASDDGHCSSPNDWEAAAAGSSPSSLPEGGHGLSFAQMLREGKARPDASSIAWPSTGSNTDHDVFRYGSDSDGEGAIRAPTFRDSFSADLRAALDVSRPSSPVDEGGRKKKNKKKNGKQKRLLFTTNVVFHN